MSFPPPPGRSFPPPPPPGTGGFAPPPPPGIGGFAPPPPPGAGGFAPPPPPGAGGFPPPQPSGAGGFAPRPAAQSRTTGGFAPPPPPGAGGFQTQSSPTGSFAPPPPQRAGAGGFAPPPPPGAAAKFTPPPPPGVGGGFAPPPPGQQQSNQPPQQGSFAPPPPPGTSIQQLNSSLNNLSIQPPSVQTSRPAPAMFTPGTANPPLPGAGGGFHPQPPPGAGGPKVFAPGPSQNPPQMMSMQPPGVASPQPGAAPVVPNGAISTTVNEFVDYNVSVPGNLIRWATSKLPQTANHANAMKLPMGAVLRPLAPERSEEDAVDTVEPGTAGIVRCKRCRTYINAFVSWSDHGRRWKCNICGQINDTHSAYFCHLDEQGLRRDRFDRPELCKGVVEFIAPPEYMVRPPQEPSYFFVIDVSAAAVRSGMVAATARAIKASLDDLPGRGRTKIGFITFDSGVHYYNLSPGLPSPQMCVVSDLKELFVPLPDDLLVNLEDSRAVVDTLLDNLPEMFAQNPVVGQSCLGPALKAAFTIMKQIGGKMCVFQSVIPNLGDGSLRPRDQPGLVGTPNEIKLLRSDNAWYKETAIEFSRQQISVDMFLFPYAYLDFAALGELPKYTAGSLHSYPFFNLGRDGPQFETQLQKTLTQLTAFEAVMRIRCTKGMRITNFYGNFYIRGTDLLALPNCNTESVFAFDLAHEEQSLTSSHVAIQAALLYTSSDGERRIRVITKALPVSALLSDVMKSVDIDTACSLLSKQALDIAIKSNLDNSRMRLQQICVEAIRASKSGDKRTVSGYQAPPAPGQHGAEEELKIPENLSLLPLYTLAMMKNVAFRGGTDVHPDERIQAHHTLNGLWVDRSKHYIYPRMYAIHNMSASAGRPVDPNISVDLDSVAGRKRIVLPPAVNLSVDRLSSDGLYLLENGVELFLWVGRSADIGLISSLFGVHSLDDMDANTLKVNTSGDEFSSRFGAIVNALNDDPADPLTVSPKIRVIREGDAHMEDRFFWFMVEDRAAFQGGTFSYDEFMNFVQNPNASAGVPRQPGPPGAPGVAPPHAGPPGHAHHPGMQPQQQQPNRMDPPPPHQGISPPAHGMPHQPPGPVIPPGPGVQNLPPPGHTMQQRPGMPPPPAAAGLPSVPGMPPPPGRGLPPQQPHLPQGGPPAPGSHQQGPPGNGGYATPSPHQGYSGPPNGGPPQYQQSPPIGSFGGPQQKAGPMGPPPGRPGPPPTGPPPPGPPRGNMPPPPPRYGMPAPPPPQR